MGRVAISMGRGGREFSLLVGYQGIGLFGGLFIVFMITFNLQLFKCFCFPSLSLVQMQVIFVWLC